MKKNYTGDGLKFFNACAASPFKKDDIQKAMGMKSTSTFFGLYKKDIFDQETKELAAKALGKKVEEIFPSKTDNVEEPAEQYGKEPRFSTGKEENTSKKLSDSNKDILNSSFTKNEQDMYNRYMALLEHKERNMEKLINNNEKFANGLLMLISKLGLKEDEYPKQKQA